MRQSHPRCTCMCLFMQEMYYRHLHGLRQSDIITLEHRRESWRNYVRLFEVLQTQNTKMNLPNVWLWDMIDEFLYQFGLYTSIKGLVSERTTSEIEFLKANQDVWDPAKVQHLFIEQISCMLIIYGLNRDDFPCRLEQLRCPQPVPCVYYINTEAGAHSETQ